MKIHERRLFKHVKDAKIQLPDELVLKIIPKLKINTRYPKPYALFSISEKIPGTTKFPLGSQNNLDIEYNLKYFYLPSNDYGIYWNGLIVYSSEDISDCIDLINVVADMQFHLEFEIDTLFKKQITM